MHVYVIDEENEEDLEIKINDILSSYYDEDIIDIKYNIGIMNDFKEQIYCFSAMIICKGYKD